MKLVAELSLGRRERVAVVQVGQKFIVVGITSTQVTRLAEYDSTASAWSPVRSGPGVSTSSAFGVDLGGRKPPGVG